MDGKNKGLKLSSQRYTVASIGSMLLLALAGCNSIPATSNISSQNSPSTSPSPSPSASPSTSPSSPTSTDTSNNPVNKQLIGTWEGKDSSGKDFTLIFSSDGNMFPILENGKRALKFSYKLDPATKPQNIDITLRKKTIQTILEFTSDGQLRIQLDGVNPEKSRPSDFNSKATLLKKVSDSETPPANVKLDDSQKESNSNTSPTEESSKIKQGRARQFTSTLNRLSQRYFVKNDRFTGDLDLLLKDTGGKPNSENYNFDLAVIDEKKAVQTIVVAKREGLKSYTGLTYSIALQANSSRTRTIVCESDRETQEKPPAPEISDNEAKCPSGYSQINSGRSNQF